MFRLKKPTLLVAAALTVAALAAAPLAGAGTGVPPGPSAHSAAATALPFEPNADSPPGPGIIAIL